MPSDLPYEAHAYTDAPRENCAWHRPQGDWPQLTGQAQADIAIIGAGFTGLSAALHAASAGADVALFDAHYPGWGASGRNGGFCCFGGTMLDHETLSKRHGAKTASALFHAQAEAITLVQNLLHRHRIDAQTHSDGELALAHRPRAMRALEAEAQLWQSHGFNARLHDKPALAAQGATGPHFHGGLHIPLGFGLEPGRYAQGLADAATNAGAAIHARSPLTGIEESPTGFILTTPTGQLTARRLILATNGYSSDALPPWIRARFLPVQSSVLVTRPLTTTQREAQGWTTDLMGYDTRHLLHYFRALPDGRFLFGMRGGVNANARAQKAMRSRTRRDFERLFPAWRAVETLHSWSGLACLARSQLPYIGPLGEMKNAWTGFAYHGNGVAFGTWSGARLAELAMGHKPQMPDILGAAPERFPLGAARRFLLALIYPIYGLADHL